MRHSRLIPGQEVRHRHLAGYPPLQPVTMVPSAHNTAEPTRKCEYGEYECLRTSSAAAMRASRSDWEMGASCDIGQLRLEWSLPLSPTPPCGSPTTPIHGKNSGPR